jgi:hypothetical protein
MARSPVGNIEIKTNYIRRGTLAFCPSRISTTSRFKQRKKERNKVTKGGSNFVKFS